MKTITERHADILGFKCYYDLKTGDMRSVGGELKDWLFTFVLLANHFYRLLIFRLTLHNVAMEMRIHPEPGEELLAMYEEMGRLIEEKKAEDKNEQK